ncbi:Calcium-binding EF-hand [Ruegeria sp. TM1040]|uniref:EF-hand domain-containing protein n=1 Tax=Ruegeria sp. (strain TM1040) TaxID=292414 RepID=UPI000046271E|nr:EF-hand domain-containing protein [Ruegeria sp. TM1040]ABF63714.1 Calcium-binding EF-hand [Ruegeria sp. TM1040]
MKTIAQIATAIVMTAAAPVTAQNFAVEVDADGNGTLSFEELRLAYPALTEEVFAQVDLDASGGADLEEVIAAQEAGLLVING